MSINILMPALSPTMTEGNLVKWHKHEGDTIKSGDLLAEIETDKATMEVEAVDGGILGKILIQEGTENVQVNSVIAVLLEKGETASDIKFDAPTQETKPACESAVIKDPIAATQRPLEELQAQPQLQQTSSVNSGSTDKKDVINFDSSSKHAKQPQGRIIASPLAKRLAEQNNIDLSHLTGSGPHERIIKADVLDYLASPQTSKVLSQNYQPSDFSEPTYRTVKLNNVRKVIAKRLSESKQTVPHFYLTVDCQVDALLKAREQINADLGKDQKVSVNDFIIKAMAQAMHDVPDANASWGDDHIKYYDRIDIAVAVAIEGGLITPVIFDAANKPLSYISSEMKMLAARARDNKLKPHEFQGGTMSLSNLGMYGIKSFSAIVNPPQACIMAVGRANQQPIVEDGQLKIGTVMSCTLSVDHRVVDGAVGASYLRAFQSYIESPVKLFYK